MILKSLFKNQRLLNQALTHRSYLNEHPQTNTSNERLEFLGDAVLELITTHYLFNQFPQKPEGDLTAIRSALVKTNTLARVAKKLNLGTKLKLSRGEIEGNGRTNPTLLANTLEAIIGALYLDQGFTAAEKFIHQYLLPLLPEIMAKKLYQDAKSSLQEKIQAQGGPAPKYRLISAIGPDHSRKFTVSVAANGQILGRGTGKNKQAAQEAAAQDALEKLEEK